MGFHCYFFRYNLNCSSFEFWAEAHDADRAAVVRVSQDPKELYVERRFPTPQPDVSSILNEVNRKYQDNTYFRCKDCGKVVYLTLDEEWWYKAKGFNIPKRCYSCRLHRRAANQIKNESYKSMRGD